MLKAELHDGRTLSDLVPGEFRGLPARTVRITTRSGAVIEVCLWEEEMREGFVVRVLPNRVATEIVVVPQANNSIRVSGRRG